MGRDKPYTSNLNPGTKKFYPTRCRSNSLELTKTKTSKIEGQTSASPKAAPPSQHGGYALHPEVFSSEDILFCIDVGPETMVEMKVYGPNGRPYTRLDSIKQAILLFINAKLTIKSDHRFAFAALAKSNYWLQKEFSGDVGLAVAALRAITVDSSSSHADLTQLFRHMKQRNLVRHMKQRNLVRRIGSSEWSSTPPQFQLPTSPKIFTLDVMYLHDQPGPDNCPQTVYDTLVEALEQISEYEGYIFESGQGLTRALFRHMCVLLSHPQQRCMQDDVDLPKSLTKKSPVAESAPTDDNVVVSS